MPNIADAFSLDATGPTSNSNFGGANIAESCAPSGLNNALRQLGSFLAQATSYQSPAISASVSTNLAATGTGYYMSILGAGAINSFGVVPGQQPSAAVLRILEFSSSASLSHGTSLILQGGTSRKTQPGDVGMYVHEGSGDQWRELLFNRADGTPITPSTNGKHKLWIPAAAMSAHPSVPPAFTVNTATDIVYDSYDFDQTNTEAVYFTVSMPSSWNEGTLTFVPVWTAASSSGGVTWGLQSVARSNDDAIAATISTTTLSVDTLLATGDLHRGPESSAVTVEGSPAANDTVFFFILRLPANGSDTLAADAKLIGIELYLTTDAAVDVA
jgi:hypothetical protein